MKINESQRIGAANPYSLKSAYRTDANGRKRQTDQVEFSAEALEMLSNGKSQRDQKIEELKKSVQAGTYHVDAGKLAEKLLPFLK
ncbi:flagellar biosynthesis anti-sigma factor FlgM [Cohnella thermotolerans]|uniref:flagellar biosynthesis anti-sigma factor FlgM n=1 Tax=Cohnella thermotolerans TaxID=329858 RepID=UPI00047AA85D|nr:flagellar biosynthesis anti-sigma factor FlgM [Cohnella thermotolerans]